MDLGSEQLRSRGRTYARTSDAKRGCRAVEKTRRHSVSEKSGGNSARKFGPCMGDVTRIP
jgi:hypothetical protein